jgi:nitroimidazol reductase NimA-like FMN-containing flavoprotein (pyridoxamine 5'-phosphate oxidase superfamily)
MAFPENLARQRNSVDEWSPQGPVTELSDEESWLLLDGSSFGRLGVSLDDQPEIFPVNYVADGLSILFRTAEGTKLHDLLANASVVFEADEQTSDAAWSVTVKGRARVLETVSEIEDADQQTLPDWHPTQSFVYVRITPSGIRGRQYRRGPLPSHI